MKKLNEVINNMEDTNTSIQTTQGDESSVLSNDSKAKHDHVSEFKITVRKLEMPVRPRGVLAE